MLMFINICILIAGICMLGIIATFIICLCYDKWFKMDWACRLVWACMIIFFLACGLAMMGGAIFTVMSILSI